jgi:hypothetical protein
VIKEQRVGKVDKLLKKFINLTYTLLQHSHPGSRKQVPTPPSIQVRNESVSMMPASAAGHFQADAPEQVPGENKPTFLHRKNPRLFKNKSVRQEFARMNKHLFAAE